MKITVLGEAKTVMSRNSSLHNYFGWPSIARLRDGRIAVTASGYRLGHVCPFGKTVIAYSSDEGESYTEPIPVIDTVLDDRDGGILAFGDSSLIVTSFNNTTAFQREIAPERYEGSALAYIYGYLDSVPADEEKAALGATFRISHDNGTTFGKIHKSDITSPHGPLVTRDGKIIWVGRLFDNKNPEKEDGIYSYSLDPDTGDMEKLGKIPDVPISEGEGLLPCEPHAIELADGRILVHIRVQKPGYFSTFQSVSADGGKTFSTPRRILDTLGGAPAHIIRHSSGALVSVYGRRVIPYGIRVMFSYDEGESWDTENVLFSQDLPVTEDTKNAMMDDALISRTQGDIGYPASVELNDGSILTVFYSHRSLEAPAEIFGIKWRFSK